MLIRDTFATTIQERIEPVVKVADRNPAVLLGELKNLVVTPQWETYLYRILEAYSDAFDREDELRRISSYGNLWEKWFESPLGEWSARDLRSINRTFSGLTKLIFPAGVMEKEDARMLLRLAIELRLRVLVQLHTMNEQEFHVTELSFRDRESGEVEVVRVEV